MFGKRPNNGNRNELYHTNLLIQLKTFTHQIRLHCPVDRGESCYELVAEMVAGSLAAVVRAV